ncbi:hypothetical protein ACFU7T_11050 [Streptomyces sp. NPDC057555]|uniref:hypothetical protein n=1 Tax=Streptomyces sp. NPDC057555 TaxID=3346166 RepID=UPI00369FDC77
MVNVRHAVAAALITGMSLFAVGCAGGGADSGKNSGAHGSDPGGKGKAEDDAYKYRQCLRDNGVKVEEPKEGQAAGIQVKDEKAFKKAKDACKGLAGAPKEMSGQDQQKAFDKALKFAQCMREEGVDMPDPELKDGNLTMKAGGGPDVSKEKMEKAQKACNDKLGE